MIIAVPSKGRLKEQTEAFFARAGLPLTVSGGSRAYTGTMTGLEGVEVLFLPAQEIAGRLADGSIDLGVTGLDLLDEQNSLICGQVYVLQGMNFGKADVVVAVPQAWIDVWTMDDLDDVATLFRQSHGHRMRVATKYYTLTRRFFTEHGIGDYRIVESPGATEAAPTVGAAEIIVDITSTGETLQANRLKILENGVMLRSEAVLAACLNKTGWDDGRMGKLEHILKLINSDTPTGTPFSGFQDALAKKPQ